jgi:3D (Asp-Asp-Asp) domain-containing protein
MRRIWLGTLVFTLSCAASNSDETGNLTDGVSAESGTATSSSTTTATETSASTSETSAGTDTSTDDTTDGPTTETGTETGDPGNSLGVFDITYYWVAYEGDFDPAPTSDIGTCDGQTIATVPTEFADALSLEGSGKLLDERMINIGGCGCAGGYDCFIELDPNLFPWGQGSQSNALVPYLSIATDTGVLAFGTSIYAPALDGQPLPGGGTHDGCLLAADVGGGINGMHIDWFVGLRNNYLTLDPDVPEQVELFEGGTICP